jgi:hypothetical protein
MLWRFPAGAGLLLSPLRKNTVATGDRGRAAIRELGSVSMRMQQIGLWLFFGAMISGCGGGGGSGGGNTPPAPTISYGPIGSAMTQFTFAAQTAVSLTPNNTGGAASSWAVTPALPGGLSFSTSTGAITGTPSSFAPTNVTVTAMNAGGSSMVALTLRSDSVLLNLGAKCFIDSSGATVNGVLAISATNVLTMDCGLGPQHWVLWNYATGTLLAQGDACPVNTCAGDDPSGLPPFAYLAGPIAAVPYVPPGKPGPLGFQVLSTSDGTVLSSVLPPSGVGWYQLASDGSYVCGAVGSSGNLTLWAPNGSVLATVSGNYNYAKAYCAPGQVQVAMGPKGTNVIETITVPGGVSTVSPGFAGTFNTWFSDGSAFLSNVNTTVWVYSPAAVQLDHDASLPTVTHLGGWSSWFWTDDGATLDIYKVGSSAAPTASFPATGIAPSGSTIGILYSSFGIVDLSGAVPIETNYSPPFDAVYAAVSASQWVVGDQGGGAVLDGASLAKTPRYFGYGRVLGLSGSTTRFAVGTSIGNILIFNASDLSLETTLNLSGTQLQMSSDGTVLAVLTLDSPNNFAVNTISLPSGSVINTWTYPANNPGGLPASIALSSSGALLGQVLSANGNSSCQVTSSAGGAVLWASATCSGPIALSLDDTLIAVSTSGTSSNIYLNDALTSAIPAFAVGWLQNNMLAADASLLGGSASFYDMAGIKQNAPTLPFLYGPLQVVGASSFYDEGANLLYSLSTGAATWTPPANAQRTGTIAGSLVVFPTQSNQVLAEPY